MMSKDVYWHTAFWMRKYNDLKTREPSYMATCTWQCPTNSSDLITQMGIGIATTHPSSYFFISIKWLYSCTQDVLRRWLSDVQVYSWQGQASEPSLQWTKNILGIIYGFPRRAQTQETFKSWMPCTSTYCNESHRCMPNKQHAPWLGFQQMTCIYWLAKEFCQKTLKSILLRIPCCLVSRIKNQVSRIPDSCTHSTEKVTIELTKEFRDTCTINQCYYLIRVRTFLQCKIMQLKW